MRVNGKLTLAALLLSGLAAGCGAEAPPRPLPKASVALAWPAELGPAERALVQFPHLQHEQALQGQECTVCHAQDETTKKFSPHLKVTFRTSSAEDYTTDAHAFCLECHEKRRQQGQKSGPAQQECGLCHRRYRPGDWQLQPMFFDYSLHQRHINANQKKCDRCHHLYDEQQKKLYWKKYSETACFDCHRESDQGRNLSWKNAAHTDCIDCHLKKKKELERQPARRDDQKAGPVDCLGCHDLQRRLAIAKLEKVPRLERQQQDRIWVQTKDTKAALVPFDHRLHETTSHFCTGCHHKALKPCGDCHDPAGRKPESGGVSLEEAQHRPDSSFSCVGCHLAETKRRECHGCHAQLPHRASEQSCRFCHRGPEPEKLTEQSQLVSPWPRPAAADRPEGRPVAVPRDELFTTVEAPPLPRDSKHDFPKELLLDSGGKRYQPTKFPHRKIVEKLYAPVVKDRLALYFQPRVEIFCAGCHHHQPPGQRPAACASCHPERPAALADKPALREAYHRQCLGCHRAMGLKRQGCSDCHKPEPTQPQEVEP